MVHRRRAAGKAIQSAIAAIIERQQATCQPVSELNLIAAPPVEKSTAARMRRRRGGKLEARGAGYVVLHLGVADAVDFLYLPTDFLAEPVDGFVFVVIDGDLDVQIGTRHYRP